MRVLSACGAIAGPLFVVSFLVQGAVKPGYDPLRHPVSSLALGPAGGVQTVTFVVCGLLTLVFAAALVRRPGLARRIGAVLIAVWAAGLIGAGVFVTDPMSGFPPGTPSLRGTPSAAGALHDLFSVPAFLALGTAGLVLAGGAGRRWAAYSVLRGVVVLVTLVVFGAGFGPGRGVGRRRRAGPADLAGHRLGLADRPGGPVRSRTGRVRGAGSPGRRRWGTLIRWRIRHSTRPRWWWTSPRVNWVRP